MQERLPTSVTTATQLLSVRRDRLASTTVDLQPTSGTVTSLQQASSKTTKLSKACHVLRHITIVTHTCDPGLQSVIIKYVPVSVFSATHLTDTPVAGPRDKQVHSLYPQVPRQQLFSMTSICI